jgi:hypothetical protein
MTLLVNSLYFVVLPNYLLHSSDPIKLRKEKQRERRRKRKSEKYMCIAPLNKGDVVRKRERVAE